MSQSSRIDLWSEEGECLVILPTSRYCGPGGVTYRFTSEKVAVFKYSDHSSYSELHRFVKAVCPKKIIPIVHFRGVSASRNNMDVFRSYLSTDSLVCVVHVHICIYCMCVVYVHTCIYCMCVVYVHTCIYCMCVVHANTCVYTVRMCVVSYVHVCTHMYVLYICYMLWLFPGIENLYRECTDSTICI